MKRVTIESGTDARLHSGDYADNLRIYVDDTCVYDNEPAMRRELREHIETLDVTSENIGSIRARLLMSFDCAWNGWVRDLTAERENKGRVGAVGRETPSAEKGANAEVSHAGPGTGVENQSARRPGVALH